MTFTTSWRQGAETALDALQDGPDHPGRPKNQISDKLALLHVRFRGLALLFRHADIVQSIKHAPLTLSDNSHFGFSFR